MMMAILKTYCKMILCQVLLFLNGFEALILKVCDEIDVAEWKLKVGVFETHLRLNIGVTNPPIPIITLTASPTVSAKPPVDSVPVALPSLPPKPWCM